MTDRITITRTPDGYQATFHGDPEVVDLFGTDTIPTAWTLSTPPAVVLDNLRRLNPAADVRYETGAGRLFVAFGEEVTV